MIRCFAEPDVAVFEWRQKTERRDGAASQVVTLAVLGIDVANQGELEFPGSDE
jgi:hypothetical protein